MSFEELGDQESFFKMTSVLIVDDVFNSIKQLKEAVSCDVISKHYKASIVKFDLIRFTRKSSNNTCNWRLHALQSQLIGTSGFVI